MQAQTVKSSVLRDRAQNVKHWLMDDEPAGGEKRPKDIQERLDALGENLQRERERAEISQEGLAEALGVSRGKITNIERGVSDPAVSSIIKAAEVLRVPIAVLTARHGRSEAARLAQRFEASPYRKLPDVTDDDIIWLASAQIIDWLGEEPTDEMIYQAIKVRHAAQRKP